MYSLNHSLFNEKTKSNTEASESYQNSFRKYGDCVKKCNKISCAMHSSRLSKKLNKNSSNKCC
ncbi:hypothetical protein BpHYR1_023939 [Brachionus plicatilis]|uniref:Uncharacterized protein n=1 Tax=Brachionus plicatilis TaxID=10195 RepID=A0A3M7R118_BRAPC|nr:hypothetical protein BpHYR1_023939 [Brachionus plicatilis]